MSRRQLYDQLIDAISSLLFSITQMDISEQTRTEIAQFGIAWNVGRDYRIDMLEPLYELVAECSKDTAKLLIAKDVTFFDHFKLHKEICVSKWMTGLNQDDSDNVWHIIKRIYLVTKQINKLV